MSSDVLAVLAIGSCRVFRPLRKLNDAGLIRLVNADRSWFTHTAAAARQYIDVMDGRVSIPMDLREVALEGVLRWPEDMAMGLPQADVAVVEVSSLKRYIIDGLELNAHKVWGVARAMGVDHRPIMQGNTDVLPEGSLLKALEVSLTSDEELTDALDAIHERVDAPVLLVDHLYSPVESGAPVRERVAITESLRRVAQQEAFGLFETESVIALHGAEVALLDQNHYRSEFEGTAGLAMFSALRALTGRWASHP